MTKKTNKGRPPKNIIPSIPATPEEVAKTITQTPPKKNWRYLKESKWEFGRAS